MASNDKIIEAAKVVSKDLQEKNITHALCGGLALEFYGYSRVTPDVDFAIGADGLEPCPDGDEQFKFERISQVHGIKVDYIIRRPFEVNVQRLQGIPVVTLRSLIYIKLRAGREQDREKHINDIAELMKLGKIDNDMLIPEDCADLWSVVQALAKK